MSRKVTLNEVGFLPINIIPGMLVGFSKQLNAWLTATSCSILAGTSKIPQPRVVRCADRVCHFPPGQLVRGKHCRHRFPLTDKKRKEKKEEDKR